MFDGVDLDIEHVNSSFSALQHLCRQALTIWQANQESQVNSTAVPAIVVNGGTNSRFQLPPQKMLICDSKWRF